MLSSELRALISQYLRGIATPDDLLRWCQANVEAVYDARDREPAARELLGDGWEAADALAHQNIEPVDFCVLMERALEVGADATSARP